MNAKSKTYDVVIVGGGISGICTAIAAAREGVQVALLHNRPVLGGNASSEIRMHISGCQNRGHRETGIVEEILLENRNRNPYFCYSVFDSILWEKVHFQENLTLYLNTHFDYVTVENGVISKIHANQLTTEIEYEFFAKYFVDTTGDGTLASKAGASYMSGREARETFNEPHAPLKADHCTMGNTLLFQSRDMGHPVEYKKPFWANTYTEKDLAHREHRAYRENFWWIEIGGETLDTIKDGEIIRDELTKAVYGVWDHIKNGGQHQAENYDLDWVGFLPGKRESRRIIGDYILTEQDLANTHSFEDAVAYGGWPMDMHVIGGLRAKEHEPTEFIPLPDIYGIPFRSLYSKDIPNLYIGGRIISASHMAFGSTRVMATCGVIGQAIGTSISYALKHDVNPRETLPYIPEIQQKLLRDDAFIPLIRNNDPLDYARNATTLSSSSIAEHEASNVINGVSRKVKEQSNAWYSNDLSKNGEWIELQFDSQIKPTSIEIKFDSDLTKQIMHTAFDIGKDEQAPGIPVTLVKDYTVECYTAGELIYTKSIDNNYQRLNKINVSLAQSIDKVRIHVHSTNGCKNARIYEIRVY